MEALGRTLGLLKPAGRLLRGRMVRAGLRKVTAEPVAIALTDRAVAETIHPLLNSQAVRHLGFAPEELVESWFAAFDEAIEQGAFLGL